MTRSTHQSRRKTNFWRLIAIFISIAALAWIVYSLDLEGFRQALVGANYWLLIPVIALIILSYLSRTIRWGMLFSLSPPWQSLFRSLMVGYLANNILPARAGDLVRAYALRIEGRYAGSTALATIIVERIIDLTVTLMLLGVAMIFFPLPDWAGSVGLVLAAVSLIAIGFLIIFSLKGPSLIERIIKRLRFLPQGFVKRAEAVGMGFVEGVAQLRDLWRMAQFLGQTGLIWIIEVAFTYLVARVFYLPIDLADSLFVMLIIAIGMAVPSAPGFIGTYEFFGISALRLLGIVDNAALGFLLTLHAVTFMGSSLIGAICLAWRPTLRASMTGHIEMD